MCLAIIYVVIEDTFSDFVPQIPLLALRCPEAPESHYEALRHQLLLACTNIACTNVGTSNFEMLCALMTAFLMAEQAKARVPGLFFR